MDVVHQEAYNRVRMLIGKGGTSCSFSNLTAKIPS